VRRSGTSELTALDVIKGLSILVMVTDHVGYYFFPEQLWFRSFGRIDFPVWFFLGGYARSRPQAIWTWWLGGLLLVAANIVTGMSLLPLNALFTIMLIRVWAAGLTRFMLKSQPIFWAMALLLAAGFFVTRPFTEYGTLGLIFGVFGWLARERTDAPAPALEKTCARFAVFSLVAFAILEQAIFAFSPAQFVLMAAGTGLYVWIMYSYRPRVFPDARERLGRLPVALLQFLGRQTLAIYVFHLLLFKLIVLWRHPENFMKWGTFVSKAGGAAL
jgi:hypothetical protein